MHAFELVHPADLPEAIDLLRASPDSRLIAGGTDLVPIMRSGVQEPSRLVSLREIEGLDRIALRDRTLEIGALARLADLESHSLIVDHVPMLTEAIAQIASPQVRSAATLGGSLCQASRCWYYRGPFHCWLKGGEVCYAEHGDNRHHALFSGSPCITVHPSDTAVVLSCLGASVTVAGAHGSREMPLSEFFALPTPGHRALTVLEPGEIVTAVRIPLGGAESRGIFVKAMDRAAFDFALVSVAALVRFDGARVSEARIVLGGVAPIPWQARGSEGALIGHSLDDPTIDRAAAAAVDGARPLSMNAYKIPLTRALVRRALADLVPP
ncbi:MAG: xanthine dehydrogenase family protein subunit M [Chloroflexi bacterium]|nr:xanthine dehydrogenase family protein subunit M [Chloroflexota bacterium]